MPQQIVNIFSGHTWDIRSTPQSDKYVGAVELTWSDGKHSVTDIVTFQSLHALYDAVVKEITEHSSLLARQLSGGP